MKCPKCGAELLLSEQECTRCAENAAQPAASSVPASETLASSSPRPFAKITPYSGPYPPAYVQVSSSESRPGPINMLAKLIGPLWSAVVLICILVNSNASGAEHWSSADNASGGGVSPYFWLGLWAVVVVPAFLIYRVTRPKSLRDRRAFHPRTKLLP